MKIIYYTVPIIALLVGVILGSFYLTKNVTGSVVQGSEYNPKIITSANASSTVQTVVKTGWGAVGSIVYTASSSDSALPHITVYDTASTTAASTTLTKVAELGGTNKTMGTYTFDVVVNNGIGLWVNPDFDGTLTVTWR